VINESNYDLLADAPHKDIHSFVGTVTLVDETTGAERIEPLGVENTMWTNTVLASGSAIGFVIYTGKDTRAVMNTNHPKTKVGLIDKEINQLAKVRLRY
jgi:phospholipid-translocating ATPase